MAGWRLVFPTHAQKARMNGPPGGLGWVREKQILCEDDRKKSKCDFGALGRRRTTANVSWWASTMRIPLGQGVNPFRRVRLGGCASPIIKVPLYTSGVQIQRAVRVWLFLPERE